MKLDNIKKEVQEITTTTEASSQEKTPTKKSTTGNVPVHFKPKVELKGNSESQKGDDDGKSNNLGNVNKDVKQPLPPGEDLM